MRTGILACLHKIDVSVVPVRVAEKFADVLQKQKQELSKIEFVVLDDIGESACNWMNERGIDCDYSRSREVAYIGGDKEVDYPVLISIDGLVLNLSESDFDKFKSALSLVETCIEET